MLGRLTVQERSTVELQDIFSVAVSTRLGISQENIEIY